MILIKLIGVLIGVILTSFYVFPVEIGAMNTKMAMAIIGIIIFIFKEAFAPNRLINNLSFASTDLKR